MTGGTKIINRSLTIISLMVMIATGSLIMRIPEASALDVVTFTLVPTDGDTQYTVYHCEAIVRRYSNPQEYSVFQAELDGTIPIDTSQLSWEFSYDDSEVEIAVSDNQNAYAFSDRWFDLKCSAQDTYIKICGKDMTSYSEDDNVFTCHGGPYDVIYEAAKKGMPEENGFTYEGLFGKAYFVCTYHAFLTAKGYPHGESWKMVIYDFYFEAWNWNALLGEKSSLISRKTHGQTEILQIDNPPWPPDNTWGSDDSFDPTFTIVFNRIQQPITNAYYFEWGAQWEIQRYINEQWETYPNYEFDEFHAAFIPPYGP